MKGIEYFLEAAVTVSRRFPAVRFLIIGGGSYTGDGSYKAEIEKLAVSLGLDRRVIFTGFRTDVHEILPEINISVLPSLSEGFSNSLLESMAAGVPAIATKVGGTPEAVEDGTTGLLVPPRDSGALAQAMAFLLESWLVALIAGLAGVRGPGSLLTLHSGLAPAYIAKGRVGPRLLARSVCLLYRRVIAVAPEIREAVLSLGVPAGRVGVLPAFLFTAPSWVEAPELREVEARKPLLAATLSFRPEYGFELLVEAMDRLRGRHPEIACLVMGSGEQQAQAEQLVCERNLRNCILFLGNVSHGKCISVMSRCDLFVRPTFADGDANSVREALSLGIPVVASDVGNRPPGTMLFRTGDVDDLVAKIEETWSRPRPRPNCDRNATATAPQAVPAWSGARPGRGPGDAGNFKSLLDIYSSLTIGPLPKDSLDRATERPMGKLARLRAMTAREIGYRLRERIMIEAERGQVRLWPGLNPAAKYVPNGRSRRLPCPGSSWASYLEQVFATRFYLPSADRESVCRFVRAKFPEWMERASTEADAICRHNIDLLGYGRVELGTKINWSQDPVTGTVWPHRFWADYDPVHETAYGDSKTIHELNCHQHILRLGKAFYLAGDERYATEAIAQIESWIEQNPEGTGINWHT